MRRQFTKRQKDVLQAIMDYTREYKYPPTIRELAEIIGVKSVSSVQEHLKRLKLQGMITWEPSLPRTLKVINKDAV